MGCNLVNEGVTCWANVSLQVIAHTRVLSVYFKSGGGAHTITCPGRNRPGTCFRCDVVDVVRRVFSSRTRTRVSASSVATHFAKLGYCRGQQHDAAEGLLALLQDALPAGGIRTLFTSFATDKLVCTCCNQSRSLEPTPFLHLDLPIVAEGMPITSMQEALAKYLATESMDGIECSNCNSRTRTCQSRVISMGASVMAIHLKRFDFSGMPPGTHVGQWRGRKLFHRVAFPPILEVPIGDQGLKITYALYALIVHIGAAPNSGHYIAYIQVANQWWKFDCLKGSNGMLPEADRARPDKVSTATVLAETPYMLFYQRVHSQEADASGSVTSVTSK